MAVFQSNLLSPSCTQLQVTQDGGNKLLAKIFDSNFLLLVCRLGRAPRETTMASGWRGYVWVHRKMARFEIVRRMNFRLHHQQ
jgi:hypothetical protein